MAVAPLIKPIQTQKGMFYTFQSALEDLTLTFNNSTNKFRFSKFALLRIPEIGVPDNMEKDNRLQFLAVGETPLYNSISLSNPNLNLAQSFQSYALNLESHIISQESYQRDLKLNVSERVFWKWLKESGAVRWRTASASEVATLPANELRWAEDWAENESAISYPNASRVVQYIGDIDVINSVRSNESSYSELYIHVPTNVGSTPTVLFKSIADANYHPGMVIINSPSEPLDAEYLKGRHYDEVHPASGLGMNLQAYYDLDEEGLQHYISDTLTTTATPSGFWWGNSQLKNTYFTDLPLTYGARSGTNANAGSSIKTQRIRKVNTSASRTVEYLRSTLDGATIDFDLASYQLAQNPNILSLAQLNDSGSNYDFEFNAILIYYDVYDPVNTSDIATNLYGVYFLNKAVSAGNSEFVIPFITKEKPNVITKTNGNAFAFKVNLKFDTSIEDVTVEKSVNDHSTFGLDLFVDVLTEFRTLQTKYNDKIAELSSLALDVTAAKQALTNTTALDSLAARVALLETTVGASTEAFAETTAIMDLIADLNTQIDDLYNNRTSLSLSYQLDAFRSGYGINLDKLSPGVLTLSTNSQTYSSTSTLDLSSPSINTLNRVTLALGQAGTYYKHSRPTGEWTLTANQEILIDDSTFTWKKGQTFRLVIDTAVEPDEYLITIKTDAANQLNQASAYSKIIATLGPNDFLGASSYRTKRPIIEITCTDAVNLSFEVDKILR